MHSIGKRIVFVALLLGSASHAESQLMNFLVPWCEGQRALTPEEEKQVLAFFQSQGGKETPKERFNALARVRENRGKGSPKIAACLKAPPSAAAQKIFRGAYYRNFFDGPELKGTDGVAVPLSFGPHATFFGSPHLYGPAPEAPVVLATLEGLVPGVGAVVGEGVESREGINPCGPLLWLLLQPPAERFYQAGEAGKAMWEAMAGGVPYIGGEPPFDQRVTRAVAIAGERGLKIGRSDFLHFLVLENLAPQLPDDPSDRSKAEVERIFDRVRVELKERGAGDPGSFASFLKWLSPQVKSGDALETLREDPKESLVERTAPFGPPLLSQRLSSLVTEVRNEHLFGLLHCLSENRIPSVTVYGDGHLRMLQRALSHLGQRRERRLVPAGDTSASPPGEGH